MSEWPNRSCISLMCTFASINREVKQDILKELTSKNSMYKDEMKKMGKNPDIYLSSNGQIQIVSTQHKGRSFKTNWNIKQFLP